MHDISEYNLVFVLYFYYIYRVFICYLHRTYHNLDFKKYTLTFFLNYNHREKSMSPSDKKKIEFIDTIKKPIFRRK